MVNIELAIFWLALQSRIFLKEMSFEMGLESSYYTAGIDLERWEFSTMKFDFERKGLLRARNALLQEALLLDQ